MRAAAFYCPHCDQAYTLTDEQAPQYAGQRIACTNCGVAFTVPESVWRASNAATPQAMGTIIDAPASTSIPPVLAPQPQQQVVGKPPNYAASTQDRSRL